MPLQQISLDQSIYKKGQAAYSQALRPQRGNTTDTHQEYGLPSNSFVDKQKAEWAAQDKATKQQREQQSSQLQNIGMQTVQQQQQKNNSF